jgi:hypothetical protein
MKSPSIDEAESSSNRATAAAAGEDVLRADSSLGGESDPEASIIARIIRFARIDSSSAHALDYGPPSVQLTDRAMSVYIYAARGPQLSDMVHNSEGQHHELAQ